MDMSKTIAPKSDQLNADDLIGGPRTITITGVSGNDNAEQPVNIFFEGDNGKPYRPCKSMRRVMVHCWGADATQYVGRQMTIYCDPTVQFGGMQVGGIRISHMSHIQKAAHMALTATRSKRAPYKVEPIKEAAPFEPVPEHLEAARAEAAKGTEAFTAWWAANKAMRPSAKTIMDELKKACADADAAMHDEDGVVDTGEPPPPDDDDSLPL